MSDLSHCSYSSAMPTSAFFLTCICQCLQHLIAHPSQCRLANVKPHESKWFIRTKTSFKTITKNLSNVRTSLYLHRSNRSKTLEQICRTKTFHHCRMQECRNHSTLRCRHRQCCNLLGSFNEQKLQRNM
jgi:hypothetical protein